MSADTPLLSIVIPAYNCAAYLQRTVESTQALGLAAQAVEVIVVNDGSTDGTPALADDLAARFLNCRVVHQANGGVSKARNTGMAQARGRYLMLLDGDDELVPESLGWLPQATEDMIRIGVDEQALDGQHILHLDDQPADSGPGYLNRHLVAHTFYEPSWAYLYRLAWLRDEPGLRFAEGMIHEDMLFTPQALAVASSVRVHRQVVYRYFRRPGSITTSSGYGSTLRRIRCLHWVMRGIVELGNQHPQIDLWLWAVHVIDYASTFAKWRRLALRVALMDLELFVRYRAWGVFRTRWQAKYRLRRRVEFSLIEKLLYLTR